MMNDLPTQTTRTAPNYPNGQTDIKPVASRPIRRIEAPRIAELWAKEGWPLLVPVLAGCTFPLLLYATHSIEDPMNRILVRGAVILLPASLLLAYSLILWIRKTPGSALLLFGTACFVYFVITHID